MTKIEKEDILLMIGQELQASQDMKERAIRSDSPSMANYACGAVHALKFLDERVRQYLANK